MTARGATYGEPTPERLRAGMAAERSRAHAAERRGPATAERGGATERRGPATTERGGATERRGPATTERGGATERRGPATTERGGAAERRGPGAARREPSVKRAPPEVPPPGRPPPSVTVPGEAQRTDDPEVWPRPPAPHPGSNHPGPTIGWIVDVCVRLARSVRRDVRVGVAIGHPDPSILLGVDPLAARVGLSVRRLLGRLGRQFRRRFIVLVRVGQPRNEEHGTQGHDLGEAPHRHHPNASL
jgi:hypothetical protein